MADERYKAACDAAIEEVDAFLAKAAEKKKFANMLATMAGIDPPYEDVEAPQASGATALRADQFANFGTPSTAARAFLEMRGQAKGAASLDTIADALEKGGFAFGSMKNDPRGGLKIALGKDGQVRRLANGTYGLWSWYPNAPKTQAGKRAVSEITEKLGLSAKNADRDKGEDGTIDDEEGAPDVDEKKEPIQ